MLARVVGLSVDLRSQDVGLSKVMLWQVSACGGIAHLSRPMSNATTMGAPRAAFGSANACI